MKTLYRLRNDGHRCIAMYREAAVRPKSFIGPGHGVPGTSKWWSAVQSGQVPVHTVRGVIARLYKGMDSWTKLELDSDDGKVSHWSCLATPRGSFKSYQVGRCVEIDYVLQRRRGSLGEEIEVEIVLEIRIEDGPADGCREPVRTVPRMPPETASRKLPEPDESPDANASPVPAGGIRLRFT